MGAFDPVAAGDVVDLYMDFAADMGSDTLDDVTLSVLDGSGATVAGAITAHTETDARTDFRFEAPADPGTYRIVAVIELSDDQLLTHTAEIVVV
jgi:hypothetical protein